MAERRFRIERREEFLVFLVAFVETANVNPLSAELDGQRTHAGVLQHALNLRRKSSSDRGAVPAAASERSSASGM